MKIPEIEIVVGKYIKNEVIPHIPSTLTKFMVATGAALAIGKGETLINKHIPMLKAIGVMNEEGDVDVDKLYNAARDGLTMSGGIVQFQGMIFNQTDIDKLYSMLKEVPNE